MGMFGIPVPSPSRFPAAGQVQGARDGAGRGSAGPGGNFPWDGAGTGLGRGWHGAGMGLGRGWALGPLPIPIQSLFRLPCPVLPGRALIPVFPGLPGQMSKQLDTFRTNLEEFASKHKQEIRKNPAFRVQFQDMCATIGVDPLACEQQQREEEEARGRRIPPALPTWSCSSSLGIAGMIPLCWKGGGEPPKPERSGEVCAQGPLREGFFLPEKRSRPFSLSLPSWQRVLVGDAGGWGLLLRAGGADHRGVPGSEAPQRR